MNFFTTTGSTEVEIQRQTTSTRLFVVLLAFAFIVLLSYYASERLTTTHQVEDPTYEQFIHLQSNALVNSSLSCPCSIMTTTYADLIRVNYTLHPVCASTFVNSTWISTVAHHLNLDAADFRSIAAKYFNGLSSYCQVAYKYIQHSFITFNSTSFIAARALSGEIFEAQLEAIVETFISSVTRSFSHNLALMSNTTQNNQLVSNDQTNSYFEASGGYPFYSVGIYPFDISTPFGRCHCLSTAQCLAPMTIYSPDYSHGLIPLLIIPGFSGACLLNDGIRHSTFVCLFNQSCVDVLTFWIITSNVTAIDEHLLIQFTTDSTVDDIIHALFVDQWNYSASHKVFYEHCQPERCTYNLIHSNSFWFIFATIFGLIGGLIKLLRIVVPCLVQSIDALYARYRQPHEPRSLVALSTTESILVILKKLRKLNLFASQTPVAEEEHAVRDQIISTRVFIILFTISLVVLTTYSSQVEVTGMVTIINPSLEQYDSLYARYSSRLVCPCRNISLPQGLFLLLHPTFHQICQSSFINPLWSNGLTSTNQTETMFSKDFRQRGPAMFNTIASLCQLAIEAIENGLLDFRTMPFVSTELLSRNEVFHRGVALIDLFITATENYLDSSLQTVRDTTQVNGLMSALNSSMILYALDVNTEYLQVYPLYETYNNGSCSCDTDAECTEPAAVYHYPQTTPVFKVQGFMVGCYIVEATLQSTLQLLYSQTSIDDLLRQVQFDHDASVLINTTALNASLLSQYNSTTPVSVIVQKLMTESWFKDVNYSAYYGTCHPIECKYTYTNKYDVLYIVTTIIGLIGGLTTILQTIVPKVIKLRENCLFKWCHRKIQAGVQNE